MSRPPETTPVPTNPLVPAMSPAVVRPAARHPESNIEDDRSERPRRGHGRRWLPRPKLRLELRDLAHPGTKVFLDAVDPIACVTDAIANVARLLYDATVVDSNGDGSEEDDGMVAFLLPPSTRSITLVLRDMEGVAYTISSDLDDDHKEVHLSLSYLAKMPPTGAAAEVAGVVTHELVHCFQHNGIGTCPGGLVEGVADWVRLRCGLAPPHWTRGHGDDEGDGCDWDAGYHTTAYFLDHLANSFGHDFVPRLNEKLRLCRYDEAAFWCDLTETTVQEQWAEYRLTLKARGDDRNGDCSAGSQVKDSHVRQSLD